MPEDDWSAWIGRKGPIIESQFLVTKEMITYFCEFSENANPLYHDEQAAKAQGYRATIAPPTMLLTATRPAVWYPDGRTARPYYFALDVPVDVPRSINLSIAFEFSRALQEGDRVIRQSTILNIIPKTLRLGTGYIVEERIEYWNQLGESLGCLTNTLFRYNETVLEEVR